MSNSNPSDEVPPDAEVIIDEGHLLLIAPACDAMPDAAPCPSWCTVDWHQDRRMWEVLSGDKPGLSGARWCRSVEHKVENPSGVITGGTDEIFLWLERFQSFDIAELLHRHEVHHVSPGCLHIDGIHPMETYLQPAAVAEIAAVLLELHAVMADA